MDSLDKRIFALAIPALGALVAEPLFLLTDTAMVGHLGADALAALGLASTIAATVVGLLIFPSPAASFCRFKCSLFFATIGVHRGV